MNKPITVHRIGLSLALLLLSLVSLATRASEQGNLSQFFSSTNSVYLPIIAISGEPFNPTADTELPGGDYNFSEINIPTGVTVTVSGDVTLNVSGNISIEGMLTGDCWKVDLQGQGNIHILGTLDNRCSAETETPGDLMIHTNGGNLSIGTAETPATTHTSGKLDITNAPDLPAWEFDVLPDQRADSLLAPACSATADTLEDTVVPGFPIEVGFLGNGADPDGGPVTYAWDFGDGDTSAEQDPAHNYGTWGAFTVTLTVTDDDAQTCQATMHLVMDDGESNIPDTPAVTAEPIDLVVAAGSEALFLSSTLDAHGEGITYAWEFGDGGTAIEADPVYTYTVAGRYPVTLTITDEAGFSSVATAAIYVYETSQAVRGSVVFGGNCLVPGPNVFNTVYDGGTAAAGGDGRSVQVIYRGDVFLGAGTDLKAQNGGNGQNRTGSGDVMGQKGGRGGSIEVLAQGSLTVCGGASIAAGNGGNGGTATSNTPAPGMAWAKGGNGGNAARRLNISATGGLTFQSPLGIPIFINPGNAGGGGLANAFGGNGDPDCPTGKPGASAKATGGNGGQASKHAIVRGAVVGLANVQIEGGQGGDGGNANAFGGDGGTVTCITIANGGAGKMAEARGGAGGEAKLSGAGGFLLAADAFTAGDGGAALAWGGFGGGATATPPGGTTATGGAGALANAFGGAGGAGRQNGTGGNAEANGGLGGDANATGQAGLPCEDGDDATAIGGTGSTALAKFGLAGGAGANDGTATANGGDGGGATAVGGRGGDCPNCPAGRGGDGGPATATGGNGGDADGNGTNTGGDGGDANATGGRGGDGADCCDSIPKLPGGDGGKGGDAFSFAGLPGLPGGNDGGNGVQGGNGGDGGDGKGPGVKGLRGFGTGFPIDIPDGLDGLDGIFCGDIWFIYHCTIPDGTIPPGSNHTLTTYAEDQTTPTGEIQAHFLTAEEMGGLPVNYFKNGPMLFIQPGGILYDLLPILGEFPVISVEAQVNNQCGHPGCIQLIGYYQGNVVATVSNQQDTGLETLILPPPPGTVPVYDSFALVGYGSFNFDHWWIVIVDP